jgi:hypothetical protein
MADIGGGPSSEQIAADINNLSRLSLIQDASSLYKFFFPLKFKDKLPL